MTQGSSIGSPARAAQPWGKRAESRCDSIAAAFCVLPRVTDEIMLMRAFGTAALLLLHVILCIGPLCRLGPKLLPLLYNRTVKRAEARAPFGSQGTRRSFDETAVENDPMNPIKFLLITTTALNITALAVRADHAPRAVLPDAMVDLRTTEGAVRVNAQWRYSDTKISQIEHRSVGADLKASGPKNRTFDFAPDARAASSPSPIFRSLGGFTLRQQSWASGERSRLQFHWLVRIRWSLPQPYESSWRFGSRNFA